MKRRFSERLGIVEPRTTLQREYLDERLWSRLWSALAISFWNHFEYEVKSGDFTACVVYLIQDEFLGRPIDEVEWKSEMFVRRVKSSFFKKNWAEFYDLVQFMADLSKLDEAGEPWSRIRAHAEHFISNASLILEEEKSAYRFVGGELIDISSEEEISEVEDALHEGGPFSASREHLRAALRLYGDRRSPDYRNSIKESISSIESAFSAINGEKSKSLSAAISTAEKSGFHLPSALRESIKKLYGWTSDEGGVRHALFESEVNVGEAEAKMMIVMCSALLNYLALKSNTIGSVAQIG